MGLRVYSREDKKRLREAAHPGSQEAELVAQASEV